MWDEIRAQQLADNIRQDLDLLKGFEDELRYETNPRLMAKYEREIKRLRESIARDREEYEELKTQAAPAEIQNVAELLEQKEAKLAAFQNLMNMQPRIFISYARADDEPFVNQLYQDLTHYGFYIWWDRKAMESRGLTFLQEIRDAIEGSDRLIAVIGPHAVKSEYVKAEWEHGLLFAKGMLPILRMGDFDQIPRELSKFHCPDFRKERPYKDALNELVRILKEPVPPLGTLHTSVPSLPAHFQSRFDEITRIGQSVLADIQRPTVITSAKQTTAIVGMGGSGKSVLAAAFARATDMRRAFTDGIFWLQIGRNPDILSSMRLIGLGFKDDPGSYVDTERAKASLPKVLEKKVCLIILDDIWNAAHAETFINALGPRCRMLITTRDSGLVTALGAQQHLLGMLTDAGAMRFLADWWGKEGGSLPPEAALVARECEYLPYALALCGAMAREGNSWSDMLEALKDADLAFIEKQFPNYPYTNVLKSLKISIDILAGEDPEAVKHYQELVVFHNHKSIPEAAIVTFWMYMDGLKERSARKLLVMLNSKVLLRLEGEPPHRFVALHDLQHDYLRATAGDLKSFHEKLLAAYQQKCKDGWAGGPNDGYFFENLAYHLVEAKQKEELQKLLLDFNWMHARLAATDVNSLIADYSFLPENQTLRIVQSAIRLSAHILARDKTQLRSQLYGRLIGQVAPEIKTLLEGIKQWKDGLWLRTLYPSLTPPGGPLICTLHGHAGWVNAVSVLPDGKRAISGSSDGTLKVWDLESGKVLHTLEDTGWVNAVSVLPDGKRVISASLDNTIKVWDLESGKVLRTLKGHSKSVRAVSILPDGKRAISFDRTLKVWDLESGKVLHTLKGHTGGVYVLSVLPDGKRAIAGSRTTLDHHILKVWDLESGELVHTLKGHSLPIYTISALPDGKRVILGSNDGTLKVWDLESGELVHTLEGHSGSIFAVSVLPDGKRAISGYSDGTLKVWDLESGEFVHTLEGHSGSIFAVSA